MKKISESRIHRVTILRHQLQQFGLANVATIVFFVLLALALATWFSREHGGYKDQDYQNVVW